MSQINSNTKDDFQVVFLLSCLLGHPVPENLVIYTTGWNMEPDNQNFLQFSTFKVNITWFMKLVRFQGFLRIYLLSSQIQIFTLWWFILIYPVFVCSVIIPGVKRKPRSTYFKDKFETTSGTKTLNLEIRTINYKILELGTNT